MLNVKKRILNVFFKKELYEKKQEIREEIMTLTEKMILERDVKLKESEKFIFTLLSENQTLKTELILLNIKEDKKKGKENKKTIDKEIELYPNVLD